MGFQALSILRQKPAVIARHLVGLGPLAQVWERPPIYFRKVPLWHERGYLRPNAPASSRRSLRYTMSEN